MALSENAVKNLLDYLRTVNLTIVVVSCGLLSNVYVVWKNVPARQQAQLRELLEIKNQVGNYSALTLFSEMAKESGISTIDYQLDLSIDPLGKIFSRPVSYQVTVPSVLYPMFFSTSPIEPSDGTKKYYRSQDEPIRAVANLDGLRRFWDALAGNRYLWIVRPPPLRSVLDFKVFDFKSGTMSQKKELIVQAEVLDTKQESDRPPLVFTFRQVGSSYWRGPVEMEVDTRGNPHDKAVVHCSFSLHADRPLFSDPTLTPSAPEWFSYSDEILMDFPIHF